MRGPQLQYTTPGKGAFSATSSFSYADQCGRCSGRIDSKMGGGASFVDCTNPWGRHSTYGETPAIWAGKPCAYETLEDHCAWRSPTLHGDIQQQYISTIYTVWRDQLEGRCVVPRNTIKEKEIESRHARIREWEPSRRHCCPSGFRAWTGLDGQLNKGTK